MSSLDSGETKSIDDLLKHLVVETCDFKKIRLSRFIYCHFKLFNDYMELLNGEKQDKTKERELMQIDIPFEIMNDIVCLLWKKDKETIYSKYKEVCGYLGFNDIDVCCNDRLYDLIVDSDGYNKITKYIYKTADEKDLKFLGNYEFTVKCDFISKEHLKNVKIPNLYIEVYDSSTKFYSFIIKKLSFVDDSELKISYGPNLG